MVLVHDKSVAARSGFPTAPRLRKIPLLAVVLQLRRRHAPKAMGITAGCNIRRACRIGRASYAVHVLVEQIAELPGRGIAGLGQKALSHI